MATLRPSFRPLFWARRTSVEVGEDHYCLSMGKSIVRLVARWKTGATRGPGRPGEAEEREREREFRRVGELGGQLAALLESQAVRLP